MTHDRPLFARLLGLFLALAFLPVLLSNAVIHTDGSPFLAEIQASVELRPQVPVAAFARGHLLPRRSVTFSRLRSSRRQAAPRALLFWGRTGTVLLLLVPLCRTLWHTGRVRGSIVRRYIIRYIHDQDGRKGKSSVLSSLIQNRTEEYQNEDPCITDPDRIGRAAARSDRRRSFEQCPEEGRHAA